MAGYNTEAYWDKVAQEIGSREDLKIIAGDDEPYYRYKRKRFLKLFDTIDFKNKSVLEIGSGPGGNLHHLTQKNCKKISVDDIHNLIRGLSPFPGAFTYLGDKILKIYKAEKKLAQRNVPAGAFETDGKTYLRFAGSDGYVYVDEMQLEGKKRMKVQDFLRGYKFN